MAMMATLSTWDGHSAYVSRRERTNSALRRQRLLRSTGSLPVFEESVVAPTPRKIVSVSPTKRGEKRKNGGLFSEAEEEIQLILSQSMEILPSLASLLEAEAEENLRAKEKSEEQNNVAALAMDIVRPYSPCPPTRACNPIIFNSAFEEMAKPAAAKLENPPMAPVPVKPVVQKVELKESNSKVVIPEASKPMEIPANAGNDLRFRSMSWPALSTKLVASKS